LPVCAEPIFRAADALEASAGGRGDRVEISGNARRPLLAALVAHRKVEIVPHVKCTIRYNGRIHRPTAGID
jgi:hypothetical protein